MGKINNIRERAKKNNALFEREEYLLEVEFEGATPTRDEIREAIIRKIGLEADLTIVKRVIPEVGAKRVKVLVLNYHNADAMKRLEPYHILKRNKLIKEGEGNAS